MNCIRSVRSFVNRARKLSKYRQKIFDELWPKYGLDLLSNITRNCIPLVLEIGFGDGDSLFDFAKQYPTKKFVGIEIHKPGVANLLSLLAKYPLNNIKVYCENAVIILENCIVNGSIDEIFILFPDPWPKKRHHKRRLIQPDFVELLYSKLKPQGLLNIVTDWKDYADYIDTILTNHPGFTKLDIRINRTIITKFEKKGKQLGHRNFELLFKTN
ncbi:MAG: tRNA (guanosine(46)-N7)-methyltransferase TrmB [Coxiellaceae bacterium]|nr:tRNA (guanosine(46)-N7)-methyltransferase TrmB [Coxiellaceae bacterium]